MQANHWCPAALLICACATAFAFPSPPPGTEDIPRLVAISELVCKGRIVEAPTPTFVPASAGMRRLTAIANVRPDRCFKGTPNGALIPVLVDNFVSGVDRSFVLVEGDYRLLFLKAQDSKYAIVDEWFGALAVSTELGSLPKSGDAMFALELDLKAGLRDPNRERVLDSIRMLGNMKHLHSTYELTQLLDHSDPLVRTHVWQALLRLKDYSVLPAVSKFFDSQPAPPRNLLMPRDRLFEMQFELASEIGVIRDPTTLPFLEAFAVTGKDYGLRMEALQSLRAIGSPHSAAAFLRALDDSNSDNAFSAMQGLLSLAGDGPIDWVPTWKQFDEAPQFYAATCREWWQTQGRQKAAEHALGQPL